MTSMFAMHWRSNVCESVAFVSLNSSVSHAFRPSISFLMAADDSASLSCRIRCLQRKLRRRRAQDDVGQVVLSPKTATLEIMVDVFSGRNLDVAAELLAFTFRFANDCVEHMRCLVENAYTQGPNSRLTELMNDQCVETRRMRVMTAACTFIVHRQLFTWPSKQNCEHGVAPSRMQVIRRALFAVPSDCPLEVQASMAAPLRGSARRQKKWLRRSGACGEPVSALCSPFQFCQSKKCRRRRGAGQGRLGRAGNMLGRAKSEDFTDSCFGSCFFAPRLMLRGRKQRARARDS